MKIGIILLTLLPTLIVPGVDGVSIGLSSDRNAAMHEAETVSDQNGDSVTLASHGFLRTPLSRTWDIHHDYITGTQTLTGNGKELNCLVQVTNRDGLKASVAAGVESGSIIIDQIGTASKTGVDARQKINEASGSNIWLSADVSDELGINRAHSGVTVDHGDLQHYNSEAFGAYIDHSKYVDLYAEHGAFNPGTDKRNLPGSISGDMIRSEGSTYNQEGLSAHCGLTIDHGSIGGRFDWGTETRSNDGYVITVPLESTAASGGYWNHNPDNEKITITGSKISSYSEALEGTEVLSKDYVPYVNGVNGVQTIYSPLSPPSDWARVYGFARPSQAIKA